MPKKSKMREALEDAIYRRTSSKYKMTKNGERYILIVTEKRNRVPLPLSMLSLNELRQLVAAINS